MIYGYIRVSSDKQTVENQRFEINNFCAKEALAIDGWIEETISGTKSYNKRELGKLLRRVRKDDLIICAELSRLGRNLGHRNVCLVSIHVNAAGRGDRWYEAEGWCCYTTPGQTQGDILANRPQVCNQDVGGECRSVLLQSCSGAAISGVRRGARVPRRTEPKRVSAASAERTGFDRLIL